MKITGKQAYRRTLTALKENEIQPTLDAIYAAIEIAAAAGLFNTDVDINLNNNKTNRVISRLNELEFMVANVTGDTYTVSWNHLAASEDGL